VKEVDRHLFFDKVKFLGIDSCLAYMYMKFRRMIWSMTRAVAPVAIGHVPRISMCTVTSSKRRETSLGKSCMKAYDFVIPGWVKPLQVVKRNSRYDSHDATSPSSFPHFPSDFCPSPFLTRSGVSLWENCLIKDVCRLVLEHFDGLMRLIIFNWNKKVNSPTNFLICFVARYFRVAFCVAGDAYGRPSLRCIRRLTRHTQDFTMEEFTSWGHGQGV